MNLTEFNIRELSRSIRAKEISPVDIMKQCLKRIEETEPIVNAFITVVAEAALEGAKKAEKEIMSGTIRGPLHGVPFSVKDVICTEGLKTTCASNVLINNIPKRNATAVSKLLESGAIMIGKTNCDEFAMGGQNETSYFGPSRNPWNSNFISGGSSGGSGVSTAVSSSIFSLATDTGGSIRNPSSLCGVVGLKPTYGRVSKKGVYPNSYSLDHVGPISRIVWDSAAILEAIAGWDPLDPTTAKRNIPKYTLALEEIENVNKPLKNNRIGICQRYYFEGLNKEVQKGVEKAIGVLEDLGAEIVSVDIPHIKDAVELQSVITHTEGASIYYEMLNEHTFHFGESVRKRLEMGQLIPGWAYVTAQRFRTLLCQEFDKAFEHLSAIVGPTTGIPAFPIGLNGTKFNPREKYELTRTPPANQAGLPAISVPCGFTENGLPFGMQIIGKAFEESNILRIAHCYERNSEWHKRNPPIKAQHT